jgi:hypothetical protein
MKMGLINRKRGGKDADLSDRLKYEHEVNRIYMAACMRPYSESHRVKHWAFARIDPSTMKAIGEDPEEFAKLRDGFRNAIKPNDDFEDLLACKMVEARWRQFRLAKAEAAFLAQERCQFVIDRRRQLAEPEARISVVDGGVPPSTGPERTTGLKEPGLEPSNGSRFATLVKFLKTVRAAAENGGSQGESLKLLESVPELEEATTTALVTATSDHARIEPAENRSLPEGGSKNFLTWLDAEIAAFEKLDKLDHAGEMELSGYAFDTRLLLLDKELEKIRRYQTHLERQFDSAFKRLVEWRKLQAAARAERLEAQRKLSGGNKTAFYKINPSI